MTVKKVNIKWGTKDFSTEVEGEMTCQAFMGHISDLTGVPADRMKVMGFKGIMKPTEKTLGSLGLKDNHKVLVIGHLASKAVAPSNEPPPKFVEDLTKAERMELLNEAAVKPLPIGIENLGVTCYLNSTVQALRAITPVKEELVRHHRSHPLSGGELSATEITSAVGGLLMDVEGGTSAPKPIQLIASMRKRFPELARKSSDGNGFMQQDVDEFLLCLMQCFDKSKFESGTNPLREALSFEAQHITDVDRSKEGQKNLALVPTKTENETMTKLSAFMGTATSPIGQLSQAMNLAMHTTLTKNVDGVGNDIQFVSTTKLLTLPRYLMLHLVRFEWKRGGSDGGTRAKVTRRIAFSQKMDLLTHCSEELQGELRPARNAAAYDIDAPKTVLEEGAEAGDADMTDDPMNSYADGNYNLTAIITHQGRTAESGHYVAWRKKYLDEEPKDKKEAQMWYKFDDEKVTEMPWESLDLLGGRGDHHIAYITFWKQNNVKVKQSVYDQAKEDADERQRQMKEALAKRNAEEAMDEEEVKETVPAGDAEMTD